jgi:hypothetical protein
MFAFVYPYPDTVQLSEWEVGRGWREGKVRNMDEGRETEMGEKEVKAEG